MRMSASTLRLDAAALLDELSFQRAVGVGIVDRAWRYVMVNETLAEMNGLPAGRHPGRTMREVLGDGMDLVAPLIERAFTGEAVADRVLSLPDGRSFQVSYLPARDASGEVVAVAGLVVETTGQARTAAALAIARLRLDLALEGTGTATFEWEPATDQRHWSENLGPLLGIPRGATPASREEVLELIHEDDRGSWVAAFERALATGEDYDIEFRARRVPGRPWRAASVHVLKTETGESRRLVGLVRDVDARKRRERAAELLARAGLELASAVDVSATLRDIARLAVPEIADWVAIHLVREDGSIHQVAVAHPDPEKVALAQELNRRYPPRPDAPVGAPAVIRTGRSNVFEDLADSVLVAVAQDDEHLQLLRDLQLHSAIIVPIAARSRTLGAMTFVFAESARRYGAEDLALAEELGRRAGLALVNAQLHEHAQATNLRLRRLQAVTDVALTHLDLDELLRQLLDRVRDAIDGDLAAVLLLHEERGELRLRAGVGLEGPDDVPVPIGRGIAGRIATLRRPIVIDDVEAHDVVSQQLRASAASLVGVPLMLGRRVVGVLHVGSRQRRQFTHEDVRLLELVADRAARAIDHARLYEQARDTALTLQHSLLPLALPAVPGYDVAARYLPGEEGTQVGGDWYDVFPLRDGRFGLVVGDVVGRGVPAAAGMGQLRAALQALLWDAGDPARALEILDGVVEALGQVTFATVIAVALDPATGEGLLCTAGHPPPVVRAADGRATVLHALVTGPPLSALPGRPRDASPIRLAPGETLLIYTDGLVERRRISLDQRLGALEEAVANGPPSPGPLLDHLTAALVGAERAYDDTALVALRRAPADD